MIRISRISPLLALVLLLSPAARGDLPERILDVGGLLFGDAYYLPSNHLESGDGAAGLVLRRGYLTFDLDFSAKTFGRVRIEVNQSGEFETYDFEADFKDFYLGWKLGEHTLIAGLAPTPTFDLIESQWGMRYLMRTPVDLQGGASRDTGVFAKGPLNDSGTLAYRVMYGTKANFGAESSENGRYMGALTWKPAPKWTVDFYLDREKKPGEADVTGVQAYLSRITDTWRWGLQYSYADRQAQEPLELASVFTVRPLDGRHSLAGRIDRIIQPSPRGNNIAYIPFDPSAPATLYLAAYEYRWLPDFTLTPNVIVIDYDRNDEGVKPTTDVYLRLTAYFTF